jgi:hypothetical protein
MRFARWSPISSGSGGVGAKSGTRQL